MAVDQGPVVQSAILRGELVRLRRDNRLTQGEVARELDWSPSKLIRIEGGHSSITKVDLDALLNQYGVTSGRVRDRLQQLNRSARLRGWWYAYREEMDAPYLKYIGYEAGATFIRQFQGPVVPGLLQTAEYAEALTACTTDVLRIGPVVRLRLQRQTELAQRADPPRQFYVLDEAVIRRHVGTKSDPMIMPNQLRHIADQATGNELITVRLIPFSAGEHPALGGTFTILGFDGGLPDLLYLDTGRGEVAEITGDDPLVADYAANFENLLDWALSESESVQFIRRAADEMCANHR
jgi:transcriptional regulator with XRE-family HTH domain